MRLQLLFIELRSAPGWLLGVLYTSSSVIHTDSDELRFAQEVTEAQDIEVAGSSRRGDK
jgi:hypothetical protein